MPQSVRLEKAATVETPISTAYVPSSSVQPLREAHKQEVLAFLLPLSVDTIVLWGLICDNGMESPLNRGTLYACRDAEGRLEGVALIGHAMVVEARTERACAAFARLARDARAHIILGVTEKVENFWSHYEQGGQQPRRFCSELLLEQRWPIEISTEPAPLRLATVDDLEELAAINAAMACDESGVNPLEVDPEGFRARLARRIEMGRIWVWVESGRLIFKADVMAEAPGYIYLEGVYVSPGARRQGCGLRAMSQLSSVLLARTETLCLLVNEQNKDAQAFFFKAGYKLRSRYDTIFLQPRAGETN
ncbi:MAG: GNAT family N-acetyltransferase [Acidobacteria bacterium]|nr:GNAT family N-acetyltransferase [Acidobacteriota bacterium]